jgi:predicted transcriptional regulator
LHKNKIEQETGWREATLSWCMAEAKEKGLKEKDLWGALS